MESTRPYDYCFFIVHWNYTGWQVLKQIIGLFNYPVVHYFGLIWMRLYKRTMISKNISIRTVGKKIIILRSPVSSSELFGKISWTETSSITEAFSSSSFLKPYFLFRASVLLRIPVCASELCYFFEKHSWPGKACRSQIQSHHSITHTITGTPESWYE
jgi:hypothetical protein